MMLESFPPDVLPEAETGSGSFYGSYFYDTKVVLGKIKNGEVYTVYARIYLDDNGDVEDSHWSYTGPDAYSVGIDNLVSWAHIPQF